MISLRRLRHPITAIPPADWATDSHLRHRFAQLKSRAHLLPRLPSSALAKLWELLSHPPATRTMPFCSNVAV